MSRRFSNFQWFVATVVVLSVTGLLWVSPARAGKPVGSIITPQGSCLHMVIPDAYVSYPGGRLPDICSYPIPIPPTNIVTWISDIPARGTTALRDGPLYQYLDLNLTAPVASLGVGVSVFRQRHGGSTYPIASGSESFSMLGTGVNPLTILCTRVDGATFNAEDYFGVMVTLSGMIPSGSTFTIDSSCRLTSPLFDPAWPGQTSAAVPTVSEWGMLILALFLAGTSVWVIRRRPKIGR